MGTCTCHHLPPEGAFHIGKEYPWQYVIDGIVVEDENGIRICFNEIIFLIYFKK